MLRTQKALPLICICLVSCLVLSGCSSVSQDDLAEAKQQSYGNGYAQGLDEGMKLSLAETESARTETIETPYYTIELPPSWEGTYEYTYDEGFSDLPLMAAYAGYRVKITNKADGKMMFTVCCAKEEYTGVGNGWFETEIGRATLDPQYKIYLGRTIYLNMGDEETGYGKGAAFGPDRTNEYTNYITIK